MTYHMVKFETVNLPEFNPFTQAGSRQVLAPRARMADGGVFDRLGVTQAPQGPGALVFVANYFNDQRNIAEQQYIALLGAVGKAGWLVRKQSQLGTYQRIWARLDRVDQVYDGRFNGLVPDIRCQFYVIDPTWNGQRTGAYEPANKAMRALPADEYQLGAYDVKAAQRIVGTAGTSSVNGTIVNGGNAPIYGVRLKAAAVSNTLTGGFFYTYTATGIEGTPVYNVKLTGNVGTALADNYILDTLAKVVTDNASTPASRYASFEYGTSHTEEHWLILYPGANTITIGTNSGNFPTGNINFDFDFCDAWQ